MRVENTEREREKKKVALDNKWAHTQTYNI